MNKHYKKCEYNYCRKPSVYYIGWLEGLVLRFGYVCKAHDAILGRKNIVEIFNFSTKQAYDLDLYLDKET